MRVTIHQPERKEPVPGLKAVNATEPEEWEMRIANDELGPSSISSFPVLILVLVWVDEPIFWILPVAVFGRMQVRLPGISKILWRGKTAGLSWKCTFKGFPHSGACLADRLPADR
jgi:hypothetical protein